MTTTDRPETQAESLEGLGRYAFGWSDSDEAGAAATRGLSEAKVREISALKNEPEWMLNFRLKGLRLFDKKPMPNWGADLSGIDFDNIKYFVRSSEKQAATWDDLPADIKNTYDKLGIPEAEKQRLIAGVAAQYESEVVYHSIREDLEEKGVLFLDTDTALREHNDLFQEYFGSVIPAGDNKFSALNTAVWSGGSFIYVPKGVHVDIPLQAYFRINTENMGQFERTLIIADEDSYVHYVEGCLPAGELVTTADGDLRPIESIRVGDHVLGHDGRPHRVTAVQMRDLNGELYRFTPMSPANAFNVTSEHPVLVAIDGGDLSFVAAKEVPLDARLVYPKPRVDWVDTVLPLSFARLAGVYLASGTVVVTPDGPAIALTLPMPEGDLVDDVRRAAKELYDAESLVHYDELRGTTTVTIDGPAPFAALTQHLGEGRRFVSTDVFAQDEVFVREFLRCVVGGRADAMSSAGGLEHRVSVGNRELAFQLQALVARLGTFARVEQTEAGFVVAWCEDGSCLPGVVDMGGYFLVPIEKRDIREAHEPVYNLDVEEPDSYLAYGFAVHNCTAPIYSSDSLHSAVVEIIVKKNARVRYTTIQNWSNNVYNLVTKRALAQDGATMEWIDGNLGCLAEGSTVTTDRGDVPIEGLEAGDRVLAYDAREGLCFRRVVAKKFSGLQSVREVRTGERALRVTDNHPFLTDASRGAVYTRADRLVEVVLPTAEALATVNSAMLVRAGQVLAPQTAIAICAANTSIERCAVTVSEPLEVVPTWDIEVEGTGNFVSQGFIVHNSKVTMKYPAVWMVGEHAKGETLSVAFAGEGQHQDAGAKMVHAAPYTSSTIISKSVARGGGRTSYRGLVQVQPGAHHSKSTVKCDALLVDTISRSDTYPYVDVREDDVQMGHEATVSKVSEEQLFYLMSRGMSEDEAMAMIVRGFVEPIARELPMEYALELNRLIELQMEGAVG